MVEDLKKRRYRSAFVSSSTPSTSRRDLSVRCWRERERCLGTWPNANLVSGYLTKRQLFVWVPDQTPTWYLGTWPNANLVSGYLTKRQLFVWVPDQTPTWYLGTWPNANLVSGYLTKRQIFVWVPDQTPTLYLGTW